jgi:hypothetical protein
MAAEIVTVEKFVIQKANLFITKVLRPISCQGIEVFYSDSQFIKLFLLQKE